MTRHRLKIRTMPWALGLTLLTLALLFEFTPLSDLVDSWLLNQMLAKPALASKNPLTITLAPYWLSTVLTVLVIAVLANTLPRLKPLFSVAVCGLTVLILLAVSFALLSAWQLWMPVASAAMVPLLALIVASALRLFVTHRFLNLQFDKLSDNPRLALPAPSDLHPPLLLKQLLTLFQPRGWLLTRDNHTLFAEGLATREIPATLVAGQWYFQGNRAWISLLRGTSAYQLGLILPDDLGREMIQQYLQGLHLDNSSSPETRHSVKTRSGELLTARVRRLRSAQKNLQRQHTFISHSFEHMPDGMIVTDQLGMIRFANGHIERWFGEPMPSLTGLPLAKLLSAHDQQPNTPWAEIISDTLLLRQAGTSDLRIRNRDCLIHLAPFRLPDSDQHGIIANISDISELREQQRQHREAIDFISHDVRSPLVSQLALIEQLKRRGTNQIQPLELEQLGKLARRSYQLAEEFVQLARAEQLTEARFYECELLDIVENARDSVSEQATEKHIQTYLQGTENLWLRGNPELLERAVINLIGNAIKYSEPGSQVVIQVFRAGHMACLAIADEGSGIDADELGDLFNRYQRQKRSEISGEFGTGLGLSFVKTVIEKHRGTIVVSSSPGLGSTFTIKLPLTSPLL